MTSGEQQPEHGRHRHGTGTWTPQVQQLHAPAHARLEPEVPAEITVPGLRKFDLGSIPASVTPPRSWRRAAWFAVGASMLVVFGLIFAASTLMGRSRNPGGIDALPGFPSMPLLLETPSETGVGSTPKPTPSKRPEQQQRSSLMSSPPHRPASSGTTNVTPVTPSSESPTSEAPAPPPIRETTPPRVFAVNDPKEIGDRTETYYKQVTANPSAAYKMTTGDMYLQGEDAFKRRYAGIRSVQVRRMSIDPNQGTTVSEVKITKTDGSTITEVRKLRFTSGSNPKISSEVTH
ncbi:hypothetical protein [Actinocrispum sp. NPDC049592]|uniref:hypothetical protein n=1 Tax=Actinocrispum sp. NPDC049592 TaxID=3154835 RepID=UPI0034313DD1